MDQEATIQQWVPIIDTNAIIWVLSLSIIVLIFTAVIALKNRKNWVHFLRISGAGIIVAMSVLLMPILQDYLYSFLTAIQLGVLSGAYDALFPVLSQMHHHTVSDGLYGFYLTFLQLLMVLGPVFMGGIIITFFESFLDKCQYWMLKKFCPIYYLSELNDHSLLLAKNIVKEQKNKKSLVVFCNYDKSTASAQLVKEAKEHHFLLLPMSECEKIKPSKKKTTYFEIAQNVDLNLDRTKKLLDFFHQKPAYADQITCFLFTDQTEAEIVVNSINQNKLAVHIIDIPRRMAYQLMQDMPLYLGLDQSKNKKISTLVVGADHLGMEVVKAMTWCGQLGADYHLSIQVVDQRAHEIEKEFQLRCPGLANDTYDIAFHQANVNSIDFQNILKQYGADINYIVICLGDRDKAINTALYLREFYLRLDATIGNEPIINVFVPNRIKYSYVPLLSTKNQSYIIYPFGSLDDFYSYKRLVESKMERMAINAQAYYNLAYMAEEEKQKIDLVEHKRAVVKDYNKNEIDKRSNRANVIHIPYKLYWLGFEMVAESEATPEEIENAETTLGKCQALLKNIDIQTQLAIIEHDRWNAFQVSEGYQCPTDSELAAYRNHTQNHKYVMAKWHACICSWDALDDLGNKFNKNFKNPDFDFVRNMLAIIGAQKDARITINDCGYLLVERKKEA